MTVRIDQNVLLYGVDSSGVVRPLLVDSLGQPSGSVLPMLRLTMNTTQSVNSGGSGSKMSFDTMSMAADGWTPVPTAPVTDISMPFTGLVRMTVDDVDYGVDTAGNTGDRGLFTRKNNDVTTTRAISIIHSTSVAGSRPVNGGSRLFSVVAGDTLQVYCSHSFGSALLIAVASCFLEYVRLGTYTFSGAN